jgi:branched-chain amino acid transport system substrate-binding protein
MHMIYQVVSQLGPRPKAEDAVKLMSNMKFDSPRGPIMIDPETRDIVQNVYLRRVVAQGDRLVNKNFDTIPMVKDPWKVWNPEKK